MCRIIPFHEKHEDKASKIHLLGPVAPTSLNFKSYLSPDLRTSYGRLYGS